MNIFKNTFVIITTSIILIACDSSKKENASIELFKEYYAELKKGTEDKWNYTADTVNLWFDDKDGEPILQIKGMKPGGRWKEWDKEMKAESNYDSLWFDISEHAVKGYFFENNEFYQLIGKPPTKTLRTYWFNQNNKIHEILIYWIPEENTTTGEKLKPIVEWAMKYDSTEIQYLYPNNQLIPSEENARRWKDLLKKYHEAENAK